MQQNLRPCCRPSIQGKEQPGFVTHDREYRIKMGGVEARLMHVGSAYTHGDTIVYFPNLKVVAVGKLLTSSPIPDYAQGNCLPEWVPVLGEVLKLDFDAAVPANFKDKLERLVNFAIQLVNDGVRKGQLVSGLETEKGSLRLNLTSQELDRSYAENPDVQAVERWQTNLDVNPAIAKENEQWNGRNRSSKKFA